MQYGYLIGCGILGTVWWGLFLLRKDLRRPMWFGSLLGAPFGLTEFLYVPEYWNPPSLFDLIHRIGFGIESILFGFAVGGIASVLFEVVDGDRVVKIPRDHRTHWVPYVFVAAVFGALELLMPSRSIYNLSAALLLGASLIAFRREDLGKPIFASGFLFGVTYFFLFKIFLVLFPEYVGAVYALGNFWGVMVWGIPVEEVVFAFSVGACWSTFYEYIEGYRLKRMA